MCYYTTLLAYCLMFSTMGRSSENPNWIARVVLKSGVHV